MKSIASSATVRSTAIAEISAAWGWSARKIKYVSPSTSIETLLKIVRYFRALSGPRPIGSELQWRQAPGRPITAGKWVSVKKPVRTPDDVLCEIRQLLAV